MWDAEMYASYRRQATFQTLDLKLPESRLIGSFSQNSDDTNV